MKRAISIACILMMILLIGAGFVYGKKPQPPDPPEDPDIQQIPWGVDRIDADKVWGANTGAGIRVAILDTGVDTDHPDLAANIKGGINTVGEGEPDGNYEDTHGHGTGIAGVIAAVDNTEGVIGIGPDIELYAVRFREELPMLTDENGQRPDLYEAMRWCIDNDMQVINMSFTVWSVKWENGEPLPDKPEHDPLFYDLIKEAYDAGIVLVAAIGNDGIWVDNYDPDAYHPPDEDMTHYKFPASYSEVIGVSATRKAGRKDYFASFSNYGPAVDLAAPGSNVETTIIGGYGTFGGTSAACPHVAAAAALVLKQFASQNPSPDWVKARLTSTAEYLRGLNPDQQGAGMVDAEAAVTESSGAPLHYRMSPGDKLPIAWGEIKDSQGL